MTNLLEKNYREAEREYQEEYSRLIDQYGNATNVPKEKHQHISEILRAKTILAYFPEENPVHILNKYLVVPNIVSLLTGESHFGNHAKDHRGSKRSDKYNAIINWCKDNVGKETTVYEVAEVGNVSYPTANNFVKTRVDLFSKIKKGSYIIRDPETERAEEKQQA